MKILIYVLGANSKGTVFKNGGVLSLNARLENWKGVPVCLAAKQEIKSFTALRFYNLHFAETTNENKI